jgi:hypothetical protein
MTLYLALVYASTFYGRLLLSISIAISDIRPYNEKHKKFIAIDTLTAS